MDRSKNKCKNIIELLRLSTGAKIEMFSRTVRADRQGKEEENKV